MHPFSAQIQKKVHLNEKRNGPPYVGFTYVGGGKSIYLSQNNM